MWPSYCSAPPGQVWLSLSRLALCQHHNRFVTVCQSQCVWVPAPEWLSWVHATPAQVCPSLSRVSQLELPGPASALCLFARVPAP